MYAEKPEPTDLAVVQELFGFLQGRIPEGYKIPRKCRLKLTADQAWTAIWYIQNLNRQIPEQIERCDVCGDLYDSHAEGDCLDYGKAPYLFCGACNSSWEYEQKKAKDPEAE